MKMLLLLLLLLVFLDAILISILFIFCSVLGFNTTMFRDIYNSLCDRQSIILVFLSLDIEHTKGKERKLNEDRGREISQRIRCRIRKRKKKIIHANTE